jgi:RNA polymerase sigma-70 factor (ECF subfamily)
VASPHAPAQVPDEAPQEQSADLTRLLGEAARGDERAWRAIVDLYARRVYALARSRLGGGGAGISRSAARGAGPFDQGHDAAEEVTQSVFVTVAAKLGSGEYAEQGRFEPWLFRIAMNRIRDEVRRLRRAAEPTDPESLAAVADRAAPARAADEAQLASLRAAMERLTEADREIVELRHHAGLSFKQMAELLEEPLGTLLARHHRALRKLKDLMLSAGNHPATGAAREATT